MPENLSTLLRSTEPTVLTTGWGRTFGDRPTMLWPQLQSSDASKRILENKHLACRIEASLGGCLRDCGLRLPAANDKAAIRRRVLDRRE